MIKIRGEGQYQILQDSRLEDIHSATACYALEK